MSNWKSVQLSSIVPPALPQALASTTQIIEKFIEIFKQALNAAKVYQATLGGSTPDVLGTLVTAVVDIVEGFLQAGKVHALFIPIPKQTGAKPASVPPTLEDVAFELGFDLANTAITFSSGANQSYAELAGATGGNKAFYNSFLNSLMDVLDVSRPQYNAPGDAVTMTVLMLGAPSFTEVAKFASAFNRVFRPSGNGDFTASTIPVAQNLKARIIGAPSGKNISVRLDWDPPAASIKPLFFPGVSMRVAKYAVIRCSNPWQAKNASTVLDFFNTQDLVEGLESTDFDKVSKVISVGSGTNASYVDSDTLDASVSYCYCVAWQIEVTEGNTIGLMPYDKVSNVVKTRAKVPMPSQQGQPPDWVAMGSVLDLVPDLATQVRVLLERIKVLADRKSGSATDAITTTITLLENNLDRFASQIDQLSAQAERLTAIFGADLPGIYTTSITGVGGNTFLLGELAARLNDTTDAGRPPFDNNEYVMGVCLVAGGPRLADIAPVVAFLAALFQPAQESNPLLGVLTSIDAVVAIQEQHIFGPDMKRLPVASDGTVTDPATGSTVPASSIDPLTGLPVVTPLPVIADSGTPVATLDPANPNAGDTNVKSPTEAC